MFLQTTNATYTNKIFRVSGVGTSIALTEVYGSSSTTINTNDKVVGESNGHNTHEFELQVNLNPILAVSGIGTEVFGYTDNRKQNVVEEC